MVPYKLLVNHWSIFTLSIQLVYCASLHSTSDSSSSAALGSADASAAATVLAAQASRVLLSTSTSPITVAPNFKSSLSTAHQSICHAETEHSVPGNGRESSIALDLEPQRIQMGPCKRLFVAPESHGFIVKLVKFKSKQMRNPNSHIDTNAGGVSVDGVYNQTTTCPLVITSGKDPLVPAWRIDPCQLEARGINRESVRLMQGRLRVSWTPNHHSPKFKLLITAFAKGFHCKQGQHPCLKFGDETLFCVSSALICDGVNHCPSGDEYFSDEDATMCARHKAITATNTSNGLTLWQQITKEFFNKVYPAETQSGASSSSKSPDKTHSTTHKSASDADDGSFADDSDDATETTTKRYRVTLTRGLSKYGPWGYLILGMLLCGGALLLCVLWELFCYYQNPLDTLSNIAGSSTNANLNGSTSTGESSMPPNYDELDPPPSYSTLFPGKTFEATASSTNDSLAATAPEITTTASAGSTSQLTSPTVFILPVVEVAAATHHTSTLTQLGT